MVNCLLSHIKFIALLIASGWNPSHVNEGSLFQSCHAIPVPVGGAGSACDLL